MRKILRYIFTLVALTAFLLSLSSCIQVEEQTAAPVTSALTAVTETGETSAPSTSDTTTVTESGSETGSETESETSGPELDRDGSYTGKDDVALYIHIYGELPSNFITKREAEKLGWTGGSLEPYAPGKCIGGDRFGNYEGILPEGRYTECDINTLGKKSRGSKRIVFDTDGNIYYTEDHYETFDKLY